MTALLVMERGYMLSNTKDKSLYCMSCRLMIIFGLEEKKKYAPTYVLVEPCITPSLLHGFLLFQIGNMYVLPLPPFFSRFIDFTTQLHIYYV